MEPMRQVPRRKRTWGRNLRRWRTAIQLAVLVYIGWEVVAHAVAGTVGATEALCPFGGIESAWAWLTGGNTLSHIHLSNLVLAVAVLVVAFVARGFFCGWMCPLGAIQEWIHRGARAAARRVPVLRAATAHWRTPAWLRRVDRVARYGRFLVLAWAVGGAAVAGVLVFRDVDPWHALVTVTEVQLTVGFVVLLVVLALSTVVERPWCRYACPLGAAQGLVAKVSPVRIERDDSSCLGCDLCSRACPMGLTVHTATRVDSTSCIGCLECVAACPSQHALGVTVTLPLPRAQAPVLTRAPSLTPTRQS